MTDPVATPIDIRYDWQVPEILALLELPLMDLLYKAQSIHRQTFPDQTVQLASLLSIKTGACPEDCKYCSQSAHNKDVDLEKEQLMDVDSVLEKARAAKKAGASRFCMGAAWRNIPKGNSKAEAQFEQVLEMIRGVRALEMEACVTLGMVTPSQAERLKEAGLTAYNHNLDTGPNYYSEIITTRTYQDRLETIKSVREAGITVCSGGIIGLGESWQDRAEMLQVLANLDPHPESVPINALVPVPGTPLGNNRPVDALELVRMCAVARIMMPKARVRLSAGRLEINREAQILCYMAGANSIFYGEKLLTTGNPDIGEDLATLDAAGLRPSQPTKMVDPVEEKKPELVL